MAGHQGTMRKSGNGWRIARWGAAAALLCVPAVAMRFGDEVNWTALDFVAMGMMLSLALGAYELLAMRAVNTAYRIASGLAVLGMFLTIWINLAVGVIGSEHNPANWMFAGVLAIGLTGAVIARFKPAGMARALAMTAIAQVAVAVIAVAARLGTDGPIWPRDVLGVTAILVALWLLSAALFREASQ